MRSPGHSATGGTVFLSFALHAIGVSAMFFIPNLAPSRVYYSPVIPVRLVSPPPVTDIGRETVAPKVAHDAPPVTPPSPASKPKVKEKPISLAPIPREKVQEKVEHEKKIDEAIEQIRRRQEAKQIDSAIERIRSERESRELHAAIENIRKRVTIGTTGAIESDDSPSGGASSGALSIKHKMYYNLIWQRIRSVWVLPEEALRGQKNLETIISIRIARDGQIENFQFEKKSGNPQLDESALRAVKKANPLPPLPPGIEEEKFDVGLRFKPSDLVG